MHIVLLMFFQRKGVVGYSGSPFSATRQPAAFETLASRPSFSRLTSTQHRRPSHGHEFVEREIVALQHHCDAHARDGGVACRWRMLLLSGVDCRMLLLRLTSLGEGGSSPFDILPCRGIDFT